MLRWLDGLDLMVGRLFLPKTLFHSRFRNRQDFQGAVAVYVINDAGNKKSDKLTQRILTAYSRAADGEEVGRVLQRHIAATEVAPGKLFEVLQEDFRRTGVEKNVGGSVSDSAKDVIVTMPKQ